MRIWLHIIRKWLAIGLCLSAPFFVQAKETRLQVSDTDVRNILDRLDSELKHANDYIAGRHVRIDSLRALLADDSQPSTLGEIAAQYTSFNNDSALVYYTKAYNAAKTEGIDSLATIYRLRRASLLPLGGFML